MTTYQVQYPYGVEYRRTHNWYANEGVWYQLSHWCNNNFGIGEWEYYDQKFIFKTEADKVLFMLKWI